MNPGLLQSQKSAHQPLGEDGEFIAKARDLVAGNGIGSDRLDAQQRFQREVETLLFVTCGIGLIESAVAEIRDEKKTARVEREYFGHRYAMFPKQRRQRAELVVVLCRRRRVHGNAGTVPARRAEETARARLLGERFKRNQRPEFFHAP